MLGQLWEGLLLAFARRALTVLTAVTLVVLQLGTATGGKYAPVAMHTTASAHVRQAQHVGDGATPAISAKQSSHHRQQMAADSDCCDDEGSCAQVCLQKCFGKLAVIASQRSATLLFPIQHIGLAADRPRGWSATPQHPPPRA